MGRRVRNVIFASLTGSLITATMLMPAAPALAAGSGGFSVRPAHFDANDPATRAYFKPTLAPGATVTDQVVVSNPGSSEIALVVYPVDGLTGQTSGSVYGNHDTALRKAGRWVTPSVRSITVPAQGQVTVAFAVRAPSDAAPGDHLAGIAFEPPARTSSGGRFAVTEVVRMVVGIEITVPGPAVQQIALGNVGLSTLGGTQFASVNISIDNTGGKLVKPVLAVSLAGASGYHRTVTRQLDTILPGDTIAFPFPWPDTLARGAYTIGVTATYAGQSTATNGTGRLGATLAGVVVPTPVAPATPAPARNPIPWALLLAVALVSCGGGALISRIRRARTKRAPVYSAPEYEATLPVTTDHHESPARLRIAAASSKPRTGSTSKSRNSR